MRKKKLQDVLPIYKIENDCILSKKGDITVAYQLTLPEIFTLSNADYESLHQSWIKAIRILPIGSILHKQDWYNQTKYEATFPEEATFVQQCSERFFNERPFLSHVCYIYLTKIPEGRKPASVLTSTLLRSSIVPAQVIDNRQCATFLDKVEQFIKILEDSSYIKAHRLTENDLCSNQSTTGLIEQYCFLLHQQEPDLVKDFDLTDGLKIGNFHVPIFSMVDMEDLPTLCGPRTNFDQYSTDRTKFPISFAAPLGMLLNINHIYNQFIIIDNPTQTFNKLEKKRLRLQSLSAYSRQNSITKDAVNQFLNEAISQQRLPIKGHFNIICWTDTKQDSKEIQNLVSAAFAQLDARAKQETMIAPHLFIAGIPGAAGYLPIHETFNTFAEQASCFFIQETSYHSSTSPIGIRLGDRLSGTPLHVDISDEPMKRGIITNRNKFILGPSGSGKSFFTNHLVRSYYEQGSHLLIVDVGHSYKGLCDLLNGYYFSFSETKPIQFNPFYLEPGVVLDTEKRESIKALLLALWKKETEDYSRSEYITLSNALQAYFNFLKIDSKIFPCFNTFYEYLKDTFLPALKEEGIKEKNFDADNFLYVLKPYYNTGEFGYLLNATQNLNLLTERLIIFELDNIKDHPILFSVTTLVIMETFISKMRKLKGVRKIILIEEAWKAIMRAGMAEYIKYLFKTVRKFFGEAIVITQEIDDIISSDIIKDAIINNSDCKILLDQSKYMNKFDRIQELLGLSDKEKTLILSMNKANDPTKKYKEVFVSLGGVISKVYRTEVSLEEYLIYSTEEKEKLKVQEYAARYGSIQKGVTILANEIRNAI